MEKNVCQQSVEERQVEAFDSLRISSETSSGLIEFGTSVPYVDGHIEEPSGDTERSILSPRPNIVGWGKAQASEFNVRSKEYRKSSKKEPSLTSFYEIVGVELFKTKNA